MSDTERFEIERGKGVPFHRLRRITGYLVSDISRWNTGKKAELEDRVKHISAEVVKL